MSDRDPSIYPKISGTEEEMRVSLFNTEKPHPDAYDGYLPLDEVETVLDNISQICPALPSTDGTYFLENGSKIYRDHGIEATTPECDTPKLQTTYIRANAELVLDGLKSFLLDNKLSYDEISSLILWRRSIDTEGNTWACHDNFSLHTDRYDNLTERSLADHSVKKLWEVYLDSRGIVSGAGLVKPQGIFFAQKMSVPHGFIGHAHQPDLVDIHVAGNRRFEVRCSDTNIKDWACIARIGGAALTLAASQTELVDKIVRSNYYHNTTLSSTTNKLSFDGEFNIIPTRRLMRTIDIQIFTYETILKYINKYTDRPMPSYYRSTGEGIVQYLDDLKAVAKGEKDIEILTNRSDWSEKVRVIRAGIERKPQKRTMHDTAAQLTDLLYGQVLLSVDNSGNLSRKDGWGLRKAATQSSITAEAIERAKHKPPRNTRAAVRVSKGKQLGRKVYRYDWHEIHYADELSQAKTLHLKKHRR